LRTLKGALSLWNWLLKQQQHHQQQQQQQQFDLRSEESDAVVSNSCYSSSMSDSFFKDTDWEHRSVIYTHSVSVYSDGIDGVSRDKKYQRRRDFSVNNISQTLLIGIELWLASADMFCELEQFRDAKLCVKEAKNLYAFHPDIFFQEGQIEEAQLKCSEAMHCYHEALCVDSSHVGSLVKLGILLYSNKVQHHENLTKFSDTKVLGELASGTNDSSTSLPQSLGVEFVLAEKYFKAAIKNDFTNTEGWFHLGCVYSYIENFAKAAECFEVAVTLDATQPIASFSSIRRRLS